MRNPLRTAARALLVLLLAGTSPRTAHAFKDYQVMVYFVNAPWGADLAALMAAETLFQAVIQWLLTCEILEPGQVPTRRRNRELAESDKVLPHVDELGPSGLEWVPALRGGAKEHEEGRDLADTSCPNTCSNSGSTKCRSLGCAFCGRCRRDLQTAGSNATTTSNSTATDFTLSSANALKIENTLNSNLKIFCLFMPKCKIYGKIYRLLPDGTSIPLTG